MSQPEENNNDSDDIFAGMSQLEKHAQISAAALRVFVLAKPEASKIDQVPEWVRMRIREAAAMLDQCCARIAALDKFVFACSDAHSELCQAVRESGTEDDDDDSDADGDAT
jgi:hypothetical protein